MQISFILIEPAVPENVGAAARALKTMGFSQLVLVKPCDYLSDPARWLAHGSGEIIEKAEVFPSLKEALVGFDFVIGTSAKKRSVKFDYYPLPKLSSFLISKGVSVNNVAIVFGREEYGLRNDELKLCDLVTTIPMKTTFPSLNLAQAIMLYAWELSKMLGSEIPKEENENKESLRSLLQKIHTILLETGFKEDSAIFPRFLERTSFLEEGDIHLLHSFCNKLLQNKK
ncbi:tRNA/rRNA methyltransferase [Mariniphaga sp.]|uniref:tRNA/rRNA methyltransferase n=1 Tax=Mariniphaga sp. TaxID=1954475 RepID=UPI003564DF62